MKVQKLPSHFFVWPKFENEQIIVKNALGTEFVQKGLKITHVTPIY
jgi:hypothetical protein